jgi:signal transduction histidine kinase
MSNNILLNWATLAISFFNSILLLWLGMTVLLNAERRIWGIWLASGGLLMGGAFFISHTAILGLIIAGQLTGNYAAIVSQELLIIGRSMIFWWTAGLVPAIALPFAWYLLTLWYGGFWHQQLSSLRRRQRYWFQMVVAMLIFGLLGLTTGILLLASPSPFLQGLRTFIRWSIAGMPLMALAYSGYVVLCIALSLDALRRPGPSLRVMGGLARQRARPWLAAAAVVMLVVSLLVAGLLLWAVQATRHQALHQFYRQAAETLAVFDLVISLIICLAIILLGQALVAYEVFTGKTLPRRGFHRDWQRAVILALGFSLMAGSSVSITLRPIYTLLLTTILMTLFFALSSWRSYTEQERYIARLRPFLTSQHLYDQLLTPTSPAELDIVTPFRALCADVLDAQVAYLIAVGPLAPLVSPLTYGSQVSLPDLTRIVQTLNTPQVISIPLEAEAYGGASWAIPLWSERGLIGVLLLGAKRDGRLYTQEEIEIAQVSSERLLDTQASAEIARRLMELQRERLAQSQVIDQRTRRVLHDDVQPALHAAMIDLAQPEVDQEAVVDNLAETHRLISDLLHQMPTISVPEVARLGLIQALRRLVEQEHPTAFDEVIWQIQPEVDDLVRRIPTLTAEVLFYAAREAIRNAARHGRGSDATPFTLQVSVSCQESLLILIQDNGVGMGASTNSGTGQGLALHSTMMAVVGGTLSTNSVPGKFTQVVLAMPKGVS